MTAPGEPVRQPAPGTSNLALVAGLAHTRETLAAWRARPVPVVARWVAASLAVALGLLAAVWAVSTLVTPDPRTGLLPGIYEAAGLPDVVRTITRNLLVLALHSLACVAGFIAGSSMPLEAQQRGGAWAAVHDYAGRFAILFVAAATLFSLATQAFVLGGLTADMAAQLGVGRLELLALLSPHAIPELTALFLPLAAWLGASRRGAWHELLAATVVTALLALPVVVATAFIEVYVTPGLIAHAAGL